MQRLGMALVVGAIAACGGAGGAAGAGGGGGPEYPESYSQPAAPLCDALNAFVASSKESPPFASTHADQVTDYLWHTKVRPEGAMFCTASRASQEAGDATILCEYNGKDDPAGVIAEVTAKTKACLGGGDWQASADDSQTASAWFSSANQLKVSVYELPAQGGKLDVMLDLDPLPGGAGAAPAPAPAPTPAPMPTPAPTPGPAPAPTTSAAPPASSAAPH